CYEDTSTPGVCAAPASNRTGTCKTAGKLGAPCDPSFANLALCRGGLECKEQNGKSICTKPLRKALKEGEQCLQGSEVLGICEQSYCDIFGSDKCEALKPDGQSCTSGAQCQNGGCNPCTGAQCNGAKNVCGSLLFCTQSEK
ncbi:MAG: hypothetical protein AAGJ35_12880, partial [Myxococcota bacterium]